MRAVHAELEAGSGASPGRGLAALALVVAVLASAGAGWATAGATEAGAWLRSLFELYVDAQLTMLEASGNRNAAGEAEYALVLSEPLDEAAVHALAEAHVGVRYLRRTPFAGAVVVAMVPGNRSALARLREDSRVRAVVPNRGLWICH